MSGMFSHSLTIFLAFFAIMNPVANTPLFLSLTEEDEPAVRKQVAFQSLLLAFFLVLLFCLFGKMIFEMFGITLPAFRITGGALVALIGFQMLHGSPSKVHNPSAEAAEQTREAQLSVAISPLAMPILAGPGTLATAINFSSTSHIADIIITVSSFAVLCLITYAFFLTGERLITFIGKSGVNVVTRMMGLILAVIGVQMVIEGIHGAGF